MPITQKQTEIEASEEIQSAYLFASDFYEIKNWAFDLAKEQKTAGGYNDCFCIVFVKKGYFLLDLPPKTYDMYTGNILVEKPDYEYRMRPAAGQCSIFNFSNGFYQQAIQDYNLGKSLFFSSNNILSMALRSSPEIDYLHHQLMQKIVTGGKLEIDYLVLHLVEQVFGCFAGNTTSAITYPAPISKHYMGMIEAAKEYMNENFSNDISLQKLAQHCHISPFHFCRSFKKITGYPPYQYLLNIRLKHARILLHNSSLPIADVSYASGFNSIEYFATIFKQKYKMNPTQYRNHAA